jgi:5-methylcytosine-specific restriction endonuclease McrA
MKTKVCKRCGKRKPVEKFYKDKRYADRLFPWCKPCHRAYYLEHSRKPDVLARTKQRGHDWYQVHKEEIAPKRRQRDRDRWANNPDFRKRKRDEDRERYQTNPKTHRRKIENATVSVHARRARIKGTNTKFSVMEWRTLCKRYGHHCLACGKKFKILSPDHVIPLSLGGSNSIANIQPLCLACNLQKKTDTTDYRPLWEG